MLPIDHVTILNHPGEEQRAREICCAITRKLTYDVDLVLLPGRSNRSSLLHNLCSPSSNLLSTTLHIFAPGAPMTLVLINTKHNLFGRLIPQYTGHTHTGFQMYKFIVISHESKKHA